jgi:hypothetical protein
MYLTKSLDKPDTTPVIIDGIFLAKDKLLISDFAGNLMLYRTDSAEISLNDSFATSTTRYYFHNDEVFYLEGNWLYRNSASVQSHPVFDFKDSSVSYIIGIGCKKEVYVFCSDEIMSTDGKVTSIPENSVPCIIDGLLDFASTEIPNYFRIRDKMFEFRGNVARIVTNGPYMIVFDGLGKAKLFDTGSDQDFLVLSNSSPVDFVFKNEEVLFYARVDGTLSVWEPTTLQIIKPTTEEKFVKSLDINESYEIRQDGIYDTAQDTWIYTPVGGSKIKDGCFTHMSSVIILLSAGIYKGKTRIIEFSLNNRQILQSSDFPFEIKSVSFLKSLQLVVLLSETSVLFVLQKFDLNTVAHRITFELAIEAIETIQETFIVCGTTDGKIIIVACPEMDCFYRTVGNSPVKLKRLSDDLLGVFCGDKTAVMTSSTETPKLFYLSEPARRLSLKNSKSNLCYLEKINGDFVEASLILKPTSVSFQMSARLKISIPLSFGRFAILDCSDNLYIWNPHSKEVFKKFEGVSAVLPAGPNLFLGRRSSIQVCELHADGTLIQICKFVTGHKILDLQFKSGYLLANYGEFTFGWKDGELIEHFGERIDGFLKREQSSQISFNSLFTPKDVICTFVYEKRIYYGTIGGELVVAEKLPEKFQTIRIHHSGFLRFEEALKIDSGNFQFSNYLENFSSSS